MPKGEKISGYSQKYTTKLERDDELKDLKDVKERCKNFWCVLASEIQSRLPDNLNVLKMMANLHPKVATSQVKPSLNDILKSVNRTALYGNKDDVESEWNKLQNKSWSNVNTSEKFYSEVYDDCDSAGHKRFGNVAKFAMALLTVPTSNDSVERAFSTYSIVKSKLRNKLSLDLLQNLMMEQKKADDLFLALNDSAI
ncbi:hypothetical protein KQX54_014093 [Cotesia glomerata]|uniref:HAT C-terminal dimerisation domain-containing protein n=1 Tax=Cotesia glomerata TaxID=32391 RepID=A0AAV7J8C7_COTGL|nr:hypothetical protein KQX54_014093 [Cotesia glomerata]